MYKGGDGAVDLLPFKSKDIEGKSAFLCCLFIASMFNYFGSFKAHLKSLDVNRRRRLPPKFYLLALTLLQSEVTGDLTLSKLQRTKPQWKAP